MRNIRKIFNTRSKWIGLSACVCAGGLFVAYHIDRTRKKIHSITNHRVLEREKKHSAEYIYIDDPAYDELIERERSRDKAVGFLRIWKSLRHSIAWRLLWMCKHGNRDQVDIGLQRLAAYKNYNDWDYLKLAQALDGKTAVLLARTRGADLRYFLPPPIHIRKAATSPELLSLKLKDMLLQVHQLNPHSCIDHFLNKYFAHEHNEEHIIEADSVPAKPNLSNEKRLCISCLDALWHHMNIFQKDSYEEDTSKCKLISLGILSSIAELSIRYKNDEEVQAAVLKVLTVLSVHQQLLRPFFENGLIGLLANLIKLNDVRCSSSAAVCLANLSGEQKFRPGLYLLHPIYRSNETFACDLMLIHGLRGGVFVTWRQRDGTTHLSTGLFKHGQKTNTISHDTKESSNFISDPDFQQILEDLMELDEQVLLSDLEVVLEDIPLNVKRDNSDNKLYAATKKRIALKQELHDKQSYTYCWPKDWLSHDCSNLRILGYNYETSISDWFERCPYQSMDIATRAGLLEPAIHDAGVGKRPVVWLTHSMGGLITKQILVNAARRKTTFHENLCRNTNAILFFSTPHKGSTVASMFKSTASVLWLSSDVLQLTENSPILLKLQEDFIQEAETFNWETICFAETRPTLVTSLKVPLLFVNPMSADLGRGTFYEMDLDHLSICKPATRQSLLYTTVLDVILKATRKDTAHVDIHPWLETVYQLLKVVMVQYLNILRDNDSVSNERWLEQKIVDIIVRGFGD